MRRNLDELHVNFSGKLLLATIAAALVGKAVSTKIVGTKRELDTISKAIVASRAFQEELNKPGATVDSVVEKLRIKHLTASEFESLFRLPWPG